MMKPLLRLTIAPLVSLAIIMLGQGFFNTFVSYRLALAGYSTSMNGIVNAAYFLGMMLGSHYIERFIRRIGHIRAFALFASINAATLISLSFSFSIVYWIALRFVVGICAAGLFVVIESWLLLLSTKKTRGRLLSFYMISIYLAQGTGQFILNLMPLETYIPYAVAVLLSSLSVIPVCVMRSGAPQYSEDASATTIFHVMRDAPFGFVGCLIAGLVLSSFYSLGPVFAKNSGFTIFQVTQIMGFTILGGLFLQWPLGHLSDIFDRVKVLLCVAAVLVFITLGLFFTTSYALLLCLAVLFGGFSFTLYPLAIAYTCDYFHSSKIISITSALYVVYGVGSIIGPLLAPIFMTNICPSALFLYDTCLLVVVIGFGIASLSRKRPQIDEEHQGEYIPLPRTTPLAYYLDPRQDEADDDAVEEFIFKSDD